MPDCSISEKIMVCFCFPPHVIENYNIIMCSTRPVSYIHHNQGKADTIKRYILPQHTSPLNHPYPIAYQHFVFSSIGVFIVASTMTCCINMQTIKLSTIYTMLEPKIVKNGLVRLMFSKV